MPILSGTKSLSSPAAVIRSLTRCRTAPMAAPVACRLCGATPTGSATSASPTGLPALPRSRGSHQILGVPGRCRPSTALAALDPQTNLAVLQQGGSFVFTVLGEGLYTRTQLKDGQTGRPSLPGTLALASGIAGAVALVEAGGRYQNPGLILGTAVSTVLFFANLRRTVDVEHDPQEWPGPKAWPATLALISFFALNVFGQSFIKELLDAGVGAPDPLQP